MCVCVWQQSCHFLEIHFHVKSMFLKNEEFDAFIDYLNVSDEFMKTSTQYDFLIYVRDRFRDYKLLRRQQQKLKESDYDYDKD